MSYSLEYLFEDLDLHPQGVAMLYEGWASISYDADGGFEITGVHFYKKDDTAPSRVRRVDVLKDDPLHQVILSALARECEKHISNTVDDAIQAMIDNGELDGTDYDAEHSTLNNPQQGTGRR
jgi:hypothetical protein